LAYANRFQQSGGEIFTDAPVSKITRYPDGLVVRTPGGELKTKHIINCAGLYADRVAVM